MNTDNRTNEPKQTKAKSSQDFVFTEAQVEAAAREWYEQANGYETWASASGKHQQVVKVRAAKALEAATRVPVQGEPNDDREALDSVLIDAREAGDGLSAVRNRILAAGFSRATVPDAALAALERVRALLDSPSDERGITWWDWIKGGLGGSLHDDLRAALDGAPEPEVKS